MFTVTSLLTLMLENREDDATAAFVADFCTILKSWIPSTSPSLPSCAAGKCGHHFMKYALILTYWRSGKCT